MSDGPPDRIAINADDHHARHVGRTADGRQFFLTTPFVPAVGGRAGCEFIALYLFDRKGKLIEAVIESFGPRAIADAAAISSRYDAMLVGLGEIALERVEVAPFRIERFGVEFGLVPREPEDEDEPWAVEAQPGNYMAFFEPWDSGDYDT